MHPEHSWEIELFNSHCAGPIIQVLLGTASGFPIVWVHFSASGCRSPCAGLFSHSLGLLEHPAAE